VLCSAVSGETIGPSAHGSTCPNGHRVDPGAVFCDRCGKSLITPNDSAASRVVASGRTGDIPVTSKAVPRRWVYIGLVSLVAAVAVIGFGVNALAGSKSPSTASKNVSPRSISGASSLPPAITPSTSTTVPAKITVPVVTPAAPAPTAVPSAPQPNASHIAQDQATVNNEAALVDQDAALVQQLTSQYQSEQGAMSVETQREQSQIASLNENGNATAANMAALDAQFAPIDAAEETQLDSINGALGAANAKYAQDQSDLADAQLALQVAEDVASNG
jgi:hypothetical protein